MRRKKRLLTRLIGVQDIFGIGRDLADDDVDALSDDQKAQLAKLRESATSIGIQTRTDAGDNPYETKR